MKLKVQDSDQRIYGYGSFGAGTRNGFTYVNYNWIDPPEKLRDEYNYTLYYWNGNDPIFAPIVPSEGEKNTLTDKRLAKELIILMRTAIKQDQTWVEFKTAAVARWQEIKYSINSVIIQPSAIQIGAVVQSPVIIAIIADVITSPTDIEVTVEVHDPFVNPEWW